jgi:hypothetical protein
MAKYWLLKSGIDLSRYGHQKFRFFFQSDLNAGKHKIQKPDNSTSVVLCNVSVWFIIICNPSILASQANKNKFEISPMNKDDLKQSQFVQIIHKINIK